MPKIGAPKPVVFGQCSTAALVAEGRVHSNTSPEGWHRLCPGSLLAPGAKLSLCTCECHDARCRDCGAEGEELTTPGGEVIPGVCVDRDGCAARLVARIKTPEREAMLAQLRECKAEGAAERAASRAERNARAAVGAEEREKLEDAITEAMTTPRGSSVAHPDAPPPRPERKRTKGTPQRCHCGCGTMTKGGQFAMGHDMKLKGQLFAVARQTLAPHAPADVQADRIDCATEIIARGWSEAGIADHVRKAARERVTGQTIEQAVKARYGG